VLRLTLDLLTFKEADPSDLWQKHTAVVDLEPLREAERIDGFAFFLPFYGD